MQANSKQLHMQCNRCIKIILCVNSVSIRFWFTTSLLIIYCQYVLEPINSHIPSLLHNNTHSLTVTKGISKFQIWQLARSFAGAYLFSLITLAAAALFYPNYSPNEPLQRSSLSPLTAPPLFLPSLPSLPAGGEEREPRRAVGCSCCRLHSVNEVPSGRGKTAAPASAGGREGGGWGTSAVMILLQGPTGIVCQLQVKGMQQTQSSAPVMYLHQNNPRMDGSLS